MSLYSRFNPFNPSEHVNIHFFHNGRMWKSIACCIKVLLVQRLTEGEKPAFALPPFCSVPLPDTPQTWAGCPTWGQSPACNGDDRQMHAPNPKKLPQHCGGDRMKGSETSAVDPGGHYKVRAAKQGTANKTAKARGCRGVKRG